MCTNIRIAANTHHTRVREALDFRFRPAFSADKNYLSEALRYW